MGLPHAVRTCLGKFLVFSGRAPRSEYWWFVLFVFLAGSVASLVDGAIFGFDTEQTPGHHPFTQVVNFVLFFPLVAVGWRRMHDIGHPGWFVLLPQIVALGGYTILLVGAFGFAMVESAAGNAERLRGPASVVGTAGAIVVIAAFLAALAAKLFWLTRPSQPETNAFGPRPGPISA